MGEGSKDTINLYPSNWLYNAGVVGFLRVLEWSKFYDIKFRDDGTVILPLSLFKQNTNHLFPAMGYLVNYILENEDFKEWLKREDKKGNSNEEKYKGYVEKYFPYNEEDGYKYIRAGGKWFFGSKTPYQNLIQKKEWLQFSFIEMINELIENLNRKELICNFCKNKNISIEWLRKEKSIEKRITIFADPHTDELGASLGKFPNSFWNKENSILICPLCLFIFIHNRIAFSSFDKSQIFINSPNFQLSYDLNKFIEQNIKENKQYQIRKLLGISLLQWAVKRRALLGAWTMMNIEVVIKRRVQTAPKKWETIIDYFDLPYHITKILLDYEIADLINRSGEEKIFDLIVAGKFSELEKVNYFVLRALLKLKNKENISDSDPVTNYVDKYKNSEHLNKISSLLPELYAKIIKILKKETKYE